MWLSENKAMTRWQKFYIEDERVRNAPPTLCSVHAAQIFSRNQKRKILDLGCGIGRDSYYFMDMGFDFTF